MLNPTRDSANFVGRIFRVEQLAGIMKEHTGKIFTNARLKRVHM